MIIGYRIPAEISIMIEHKNIWNKHAFTQTCEISTHPYLKEAVSQSRTSRPDTCADSDSPPDCSTQKPSLRSCNNRCCAPHPHCSSISIRSAPKAARGLRWRESPKHSQRSQLLTLGNSCSRGTRLPRDVHP